MQLRNLSVMIPCKHIDEALSKVFFKELDQTEEQLITSIQCHSPCDRRTGLQQAAWARAQQRVKGEKGQCELEDGDKVIDN